MNKLQKKCYSLAKKQEAYDVVEMLRGNKEFKIGRYDVYKRMLKYARQFENDMGTEIIEDAWHDKMFLQDATNEEVEEAIRLIRRHYNNEYVSGRPYGTGLIFFDTRKKVEKDFNTLSETIYKNQKLFEVKYVFDCPLGYGMLFEIEALKEIIFNFYRYTDEVYQEAVDIYNRHHERKLSYCTYSGIATINSIPYTYRDFCGCVGRSYECSIVSCYNNATVHYIGECFRTGGHDLAVKAVIDIENGAIPAIEDPVYYCEHCGQEIDVSEYVHTGGYCIGCYYDNVAEELAVTEMDCKKPTDAEYYNQECEELL